MRIPTRGPVPSFVLSMAARIGVIGLSVVASGCAANKHPTYVGGPYAEQQAAMPPVRVAEAQRKVEVEADGRPAQSPPVRRMRPEEDVPSQPWSPNYGKGVDPRAPITQPALPRQAWPKPIEASVRNTTALPGRRLNDTEADSVIARAVSAHEMKRQ